MVVVYNPSAKPVSSHPISLGVPVSWIDVTDSQGKPVLSQLLPRANLDSVRPRGLGHDLSFSLSFPVDVPALGFATYNLRYHTPTQERTQPSSASSPISRGDNGETIYTLENSAYRIVANNVTGLQSVFDKASGQAFSLDLSLMYFTSNHEDAYSYSVTADSPQSFVPGGVLAKTHFVSGPVYDALFLYVTEEHGMVVRLFKNGSASQALEVEVGVGVVDVNTDVVVVLQSNISSKQLLYTDSNGIDTMQRQVDSSITMEENSWPATTYAYVTDGNAQMAVVLPQVHAVQSLADGQLQLLVHRRSRMNDVSGAASIFLLSSFVLIFDSITTTSMLARSHLCCCAGPSMMAHACRLSSTTPYPTVRRFGWPSVPPPPSLALATCLLHRRPSSPSQSKLPPMLFGGFLASPLSFRQSLLRILFLIRWSSSHWLLQTQRPLLFLRGGVIPISPAKTPTCRSRPLSIFPRCLRAFGRCRPPRCRKNHSPLSITLPCLNRVTNLTPPLLSLRGISDHLRSLDKRN
jgi:hypothetical protein